MTTPKSSKSATAALSRQSNRTPEEETWLGDLHPRNRDVAKRWQKEVGPARFNLITRAASREPQRRGNPGVDDGPRIRAATALVLQDPSHLFEEAAKRAAKQVAADVCKQEDWKGRPPIGQRTPAPARA
jgi:hypothetical protein